MCGIAGIVDWGQSLPAAAKRRAVAAMTEGMAFRGPDDHGLWQSTDGACTLGHRRLSILDLSPLGHQPMVAPGGQVLTFNGEIYNYRALRRPLEERGWRFVSHSDTEVLLAGLVLEGADFVRRLDGMYAFALWDPAARTLLAARDPFGEKPFYLCRQGRILAFASELDALPHLPGFDDGIEADGLALYLGLQYFPDTLTPYRSCRKLNPGQVMRFSDSGETLLHQESFVTSDEAVGTRSVDDLADELEDILTRTIADRLVSDVPIGAFLSGGVDSSTVVAIASRRLNRSLRTYSIGFDGAPDSEHLEARAVARHLGTEHFDQIIAPSAMGEQAASIGAMLDEPNGDSSCMPTWHLSRLARRDITVALSGDGGDELFGGYGRYFATLAEQRQAGPDWSAGAAYFHSWRIMLFPDRPMKALLGHIPPLVENWVEQAKARLDAPAKPLMNRLRQLDTATYMPGAVLAKVDRMSMRHSLEVRSPLLGREVAGFAARLAASACGDATGGKAVLKAVAKRYLPAEWIDRPKRGFGLPMRGWAEHGAQDDAQALFTRDSQVARWLGQDALDRFLAAQAKQPMMYQIWEMMVLEHWLRRHPASVVNRAASR
jgi:asparagine synthase (glutamine-hydrolysing)